MDSPGDTEGGKNVAVKKSAKAAEKIELVEIEKTDTPVVKIATGKKSPAKKTTNNGFCIYIGPSIKGIIQSGTIYDKSLKDTKAFLGTAIDKHPLIGKLISTDKTIAEDRIKVKTVGNLLNVYYTKLSGKSK